MWAKVMLGLGCWFLRPLGLMHFSENEDWTLGWGGVLDANGLNMSSFYCINHYHLDLFSRFVHLQWLSILVFLLCNLSSLPSAMHHFFNAPCFHQVLPIRIHMVSFSTLSSCLCNQQAISWLGPSTMHKSWDKLPLPEGTCSLHPLAKNHLFRMVITASAAAPVVTMFSLHHFVGFLFLAMRRIPLLLLTPLLPLLLLPPPSFCYSFVSTHL